MERVCPFRVPLVRGSRFGLYWALQKKFEENRIGKLGLHVTPIFSAKHTLAPSTKIVVAGLLVVAAGGARELSVLVVAKLASHFTNHELRRRSGGVVVPRALFQVII
ncbi:uncharacterized protein LOC110266629 [Arachis ipaensis]|uniref:uncharacterized protein LOC110266629 n=1 Tax=Arachis ipaensis TaxID=130454 RepID=UPI000A2B5BB4|nr:uncharacterized protein LOC110266629 [Arachis ipaensis]